MDQLGKGYRTRYIESLPLIVAADRATIDTDSHTMADTVDAEGGFVRGMFVAPCNLDIARCYVNALTFPTTDGRAEVRFCKSGSPNVGTITVVAYLNLNHADEVFHMTVNGVTTDKTENVDWDAETSNDVTATNIATAISTIAGLTAVAVAAVVTITAAAGYDFGDLQDTNIIDADATYSLAENNLVADMIDIDNPADETAIDAAFGTAGMWEVDEGELVYVTVRLTGTTAQRSDGLVATVEWYPREA